MKSLLFTLLLAVLYMGLAAQCVKPTPMTSAQVQPVTGSWKMQYTYHDRQYETELRIHVLQGTEIACDMSNPPLPDRPTACEYFFCPGGEFHMKKYVGETAYVFQGTPENGHIKGILSFYDKDNKRTMGGHFTMDRIN